MPFDELHEYCGIFGIFDAPEAANLTYLGLYALQHRGQEAAGIVTSDGKMLHNHRQMGLVADIFSQDVLAKLPGKSAIGHVRYSTTGSSVLRNSQPIIAEFARGAGTARESRINRNADYGAVAVAHNGNLTNATQLREELEAAGAIFQSTVDSEVILHLLARSKESALTAKITDALRRVEGAYSLLFLTESSLVAVRDPHGFRPLVLGDLDGKPVLASETCALDLIRAKFVREIEPGELVIIDQKGLRSERPFGNAEKRPCVFELIYFARPDSNAFGHNVYASRREMGKALARRHPAKGAQVVVPVPDSGVPAAIGFAQEAGIPFELGLIRNHYVGRTFIEPQQAIRNFGVKVKLNAVDEVLNGKSVVLVDDSIVRGTTSRKLVHMLREHGAREVHMRVAAPPTTHPCFYGIATPTRDELIAAKKSVEDIRESLGADSLGYLTTDDLSSSMKGDRNFCTTCFTGNYVVKPADPSAAGRTGS